MYKGGRKMYRMKSEYIIGIEEIDQQHERLFEIIDELDKLLKNTMIADKYDYIVKILNELKEYAKMHFTQEEEYMESIGYKKLFTQKVEHQYFINKLEEIKIRDLDDEQILVMLDMMNFLYDWLVEHILEKDKLIGE